MYPRRRLEIVSFTPRYWRSAPARAIHTAPASIPASAIASLTPRGGAPPRRCPTTAAARPPSTSASADWRRRPDGPDAMATSSDLADHALGQIVHLLQQRLGLLERSAAGDDGLAGVVPQRALEDDELALQHLRLDGVGVLTRALD